MPIKEKAFRIGAGRYLQGNGFLSLVGEEIKRLGNSPFIIGGKTALSVTRDKIEESVSRLCDRYTFITHVGSCNDEDAQRLAALAKEGEYDVIVGVGGGVICDLSKLIAHFAKLPVINLPTSCATCAAYTPLSVRYTPDGKTVGTMHFPGEVNAVIVDTGIISKAPARLLLSGVFDALAKFIEIKQRVFKEHNMGLDYAYAMSEYSYKQLSENMESCVYDIEKGELTERLENLIFTVIAATGVISGIARGSNQTALAHKFYETARFLLPDVTKPYLHGELVGIGLLLQNHFNGEEERSKSLISIMKKNGMPYRPCDVGIPKTEEALGAFYDKISNSSAVNKENKECCAKFMAALRYLWNIE